MDDLTKLRKSRATSYLEEFLADPSNRKVFQEETERYRREEQEEEDGLVTQLEEGLPLKQEVAGSLPAGPTKQWEKYPDINSFVAQATEDIGYLSRQIIPM